MQTLALLSGNVLAGIAFDPTIRGILSVLVGVVVLMGSIYLILATNTGNRLGFLLSLTGFFGWMAIMGIVWWIYGIGMLGAAPSWQVVEYNANETSEATTPAVRDLDLSVLPQGTDGVDYEKLVDLSENDVAAFDVIENGLEDATGGWKFLPASDPSRGEAEATVSANLPECATCPFGIDAASDYIVLGGFEVGGKKGLPDNPNRLDRFKNEFAQAVQFKHPKHYAVIQVQKVIEQTAQPGQAPPLPIADESEPIISVVMIRDIGDKRFPSAVITLASGLMFVLLCWILHERERTLEANLAAAESAAKAIKA